MAYRIEHSDIEREEITWDLWIQPNMITKENINERDTNGNTLLHHLIAKGYHLLVKAALDLGANLFVKNREGIMPIDCWTSQGSDHKQTRDVIEAKLLDLNLMLPEHKGVLSELAQCGGYFVVVPQVSSPLNTVAQPAKDSLVVWLEDLLAKSQPLDSPTLADDIMYHLYRNDADKRFTKAMLQVFSDSINPRISTITGTELAKFSKQHKRFYGKSLSYLKQMTDFYSKCSQSDVILWATNLVKFFTSLLKLTVKSSNADVSLAEWAKLVNYWGMYLMLESKGMLQKEFAPLVLLYERKGWWTTLWNGQGLQQSSLVFLESLKAEEPSVAETMRFQKDVVDAKISQLETELESAKQQLSEPEREKQKAIEEAIKVVQAQHDIELQGQKDLLAKSEAEVQVLKTEKDDVKKQLAASQQQRAEIGVELEARKAELKDRVEKMSEIIAQLTNAEQCLTEANKKMEETQSQEKEYKKCIEEQEKKIQSQEQRIQKFEAVVADVHALTPSQESAITPGFFSGSKPMLRTKPPAAAQDHRL